MFENNKELSKRRDYVVHTCCVYVYILGQENLLKDNTTPIYFWINSRVRTIAEASEATRTCAMQQSFHNPIKKSQYDSLID